MAVCRKTNKIGDILYLYNIVERKNLPTWAANIFLQKELVIVDLVSNPSFRRYSNMVSGSCAELCWYTQSADAPDDDNNVFFYELC